MTLSLWHVLPIHPTEMWTLQSGDWTHFPIGPVSAQRRKVRSQQAHWHTLVCWHGSDLLSQCDVGLTRHHKLCFGIREQKQTC